MEDVREIDVAGLPIAAAIDFGSSNTDLLAVMDGRLTTRTEAQRGAPDAQSVQRLLQVAGLQARELELIAVTGGHHRSLPDAISGCRVVKVGELDAIARGGQAQITRSVRRPNGRALVVSAGSGTAMVAAEGERYQHVTGTGVGGGTLLGLARLLIATVDPAQIDDLALAGDANAVDLALRDIVTGPIGSLPPDATAVNFGRVGRTDLAAARADLAAALVTLVAQVIATLAVNAGRASAVETITVTGHLTDMQSVRVQMEHVGRFFGFPLDAPGGAGHATALGALLQALEM